MPTPSLPDLGTLSFAEIERLAAGNAPLPVERWQPPHCGDSGMRIAGDGRWYHDGAPIERAELVRLFSRILRREPDRSHVLVTPHEKLSIAVDDAPFVAVELRAAGDGNEARLAFRLNTGDLIVAGPAHPLRIAGSAAEPRPYLGVRAGLDARVARPVYYELAEMAIEQSTRHGVWSDGVFFTLEPAP